MRHCFGEKGKDRVALIKKFILRESWKRRCEGALLKIYRKLIKVDPKCKLIFGTVLRTGSRFRLNQDLKSR